MLNIQLDPAPESEPKSQLHIQPDPDPNPNPESDLNSYSYLNIQPDSKPNVNSDPEQLNSNNQIANKKIEDESIHSKTNILPVKSNKTKNIHKCDSCIKSNFSAGALKKYLYAIHSCFFTFGNLAIWCFMCQKVNKQLTYKKCKHNK